MLGVSGCEKAPQTTANTSPPPKSKPVTAALTNPNYEKVMTHLETGGTLLVYADLETTIRDLKAGIDELRRELDPELPPEAKELWSKAREVLDATGLFQARGFGFSQVPIEDGLHRSRAFVLRETGEPGHFWRWLGEEPHSLEFLRLLPAETAVAVFSDFNLRLTWDLLKKHAESFDATDLKNWMSQVERSTAAVGLPWETVLDSLGNHLGVFITLDSSKQLELPQFTIPEPQGAVVLKVRDNRIYEKIVAALAPLQPEARPGEGYEAFIVNAPGPSPFPLEPTIGQIEGYLILASTFELFEKVANGEGDLLVETTEFQTYAKHVELEGNAFSWVSPEAETLTGDMMLQSAPKQDVPPALFKFMARFYAWQAGLSIGSATENGVINTTIGSQGPQGPVSTAMVAPTAVMAAIAVPGFLRARKRAQATKALNELRLLDAAADQWAIEHSKATGTPVKVEELAVYLKRDSPLHQSALDGRLLDHFGNPIAPWVVDELPRVPEATIEELSDVVDVSFWEPYHE